MYKLYINIYSITIFTIHVYKDNEIVTVINDKFKVEYNNVYKHTNLYK